MAIPRAQIPTPYIPIAVNKPARPAYVPIPGAAAFDYFNYENAQRRRKEHYFDTNNFGQVNSWADVMTRTFNGTHDNPITGFMEDTKDLLWNGSVRPILENDSFGSMAQNLWHNTWVNVIESVDVVDNIWKGYVLEGNEGAANAFQNRANYNFNTGNFVTDIISEMMTPTNIATLGIGGLAKGVVKGTIQGGSKSLMKGIAKFGHLADDMPQLIRTLQKTGHAVTEADITMLKSLTMRKTDINVLKGLNVLRTANNFVDSLGPKLTYYTSLFPAVSVMRGVNRGQQAYMQYAANRFIRDVKGPNLISEAANVMRVEERSAEFLADGLSSEYKIGAQSTFWEQLAIADVKHLDAVLKVLGKTIDTKLTLKNIIDGSASPIYFTEALETQAFQVYETYLRSLDEFAQGASRGAIKTFDEYEAAVLRAAQHPAISGLGRLVKKLAQARRLKTNAVEKLANVRRRTAVANALDPVRATLDEVKRRMDDIKGTYDMVRAEGEAYAGLKEMRQDEAVVLVRKINNAKDDIAKAEVKLQRLRAAISEQGTAVANATSKETKRKLQAVLSKRMSDLKAHKVAMAKTEESYKNLIADLDQANHDISVITQRIMDQRNVLGDADLTANYHKRNALIPLRDRIRDVLNLLADVEADDMQLTAVTRHKLFRLLQDAPQNETSLALINDLDASSLYDDLVTGLEHMLDAYNLQRLDGSYADVVGPPTKTTTDGVSNFRKKLLHAGTSTDVLNVMQRRGYLRKENRALDWIKVHGAGAVAEYIPTLQTLKDAKRLVNRAKDLAGGSTDDLLYEDWQDNIRELQHLVKGINLRKQGGNVERLADMVNEAMIHAEDLKVAMRSIKNRITSDANFRQAADDAVYRMQKDNNTTRWDIKHAADNVKVAGKPAWLEKPDLVSQYMESIRHLDFSRLKVVRPQSHYGTRRTIDFSSPLNMSKAVDDITLSLDNLLSFRQVADVHTATAKATKEYKLIMPAIQRSLMILDDPKVAAFLEDIATFKNDSAIELMRALATVSASSLRTALISLEAGDFVKASEILKEQLGLDYFTANLPAPENLAAQLSEHITLVDDAKLVMSTLEGMQTTRELIDKLDSVYEDLGGYDIAAAFFDTLQRFSKRDAHELLRNPAHMATLRKQMIEGIDQHLRNQSDYSPKLSNVRDYIKAAQGSGDIPADAYAEYERLFADGSGIADASHTAIADAYANAMVDKYVLGIESTPLNRILYGDLESSGLNVYGSQIHQSALVDVSTDKPTLKLFINTLVDRRNQASDNLLYTLLDDAKNPKHSIETLRAVYNQIHFADNPDDAAKAIREHFGFNDDIIIVPCAGEDVLMKAYNQNIEDLHPNTGTLRLGFYNGLNYDLPLYVSRMKQAGVETPRYFNRHHIHDSLVLLEDKYNIRRLSQTQRDKVESTFNDFIETKNVEQINGATDASNSVRLSRLSQPLLPSVNTSFKEALNRLEVYFNPTRVKRPGQVPDLINMQALTAELHVTDSTLLPFREFTQAMRGIVDDIVAHNDSYGEWIINMEVAEKTIKAMADSAIPVALRQTSNIMAILQSVASELGVDVPPVMVKTVVDDRLVTDWFNITGKERSLNYMEKAFEASREMGVTLSRVRQPELAAKATTEQYQAVQRLLIDRIRNLDAFRNSNDLMSDLYVTENAMQNFAITLWLYNRHITWANVQKQGLLNLTLKEDVAKVGGGDLAKFLDEPEETIFKFESHVDDKFFMISRDGNQKELMQYIQETYDKSMSMNALLETQDQLIPSTRMKIMLPLYQKIYTPFLEIQGAVSHAVAMHNLNRPVKEHISMASAYQQLRPAFESVDNFVAFNKLGQVLDQTPEEMLAFLYYKAKGVVTFKLSDLLSENYSVLRRGSRVADTLNGELYEAFLKYINNKELYENMGMHITERPDGRIIFSLDPERISEFKTLAYPKHLSDFKFDNHIERYIAQDAFIQSMGLAPAVTKTLMDYAEGRAHLLRLNQSAVGSTLEKLDERVLDQLLYDLGDFPHATSDVFKRMGAFDNEVFNHSVLGHIDSRREYLSFASFNPMKSLFNASEIMHSSIATQVQYVEMLFDSAFSLQRMMDQAPEPMGVNEVYEYLQNNKHLRLAFLNTDKTLGYKLAGITVYSPKDVEFALSVGATLLDLNTFVKSKEIINKHKIPTGLLRMFERNVLAMFKLGYLAYNYAAAFRNIVDSSLKNVQSTGDVSILWHTVETAKNYMAYRSVVNELLARADKEQIPMPKAIDDYFKQPNPAITKEVYDSFDELKRSGSSSGMIQEFQDYYGDTISKIFRKLKNTHMTEEQFRELVLMPDDAAEALLHKNYPGAQVFINNVMYHKQNLIHFKRGYKMNQLYMGQDLNVDDFVNVAIQPALLAHYTPEQQLAIAGLFEKTQDVTLKADALDKFMQNPFVAKSMGIHGSVEEVMRASMYQWLKDQGFSRTQATAQVTKTHFDYAHKSSAMRYLDMIVPFSFFRINNLIYWAEELGKSNTGMELMSKFMGVTANMEEREIEDLMVRRSMQYQILAGNPVLDSESGLTLKLNPSMLDAVKLLSAPPTYITEGLHSAYQAAYQLFTMSPYANEQLEAFNLRKLKTTAQLIPVAGPYIQRVLPGKMDPLSGLLFGPLFNYAWTPAQKKRTVTRGKYKYAPRPGQTFKRFSYFSGKSAFNKVYYGSMYRMNYGVPRATKLVRSAETRHKQLWGKAISKSGRSKHQLLLFPTNKYTLKMKVMLLRQMANSYR